MPGVPLSAQRNQCADCRPRGYTGMNACLLQEEEEVGGARIKEADRVSG